MKAQYIKIEQCEHCQKDFVISKTGHRFCSTSHRAANHSWKKRMAIKLAIKDIPIPKFKDSSIENEPLPNNQPGIMDHNALQTELVNKQQDYKPTFLKDMAASALPNIAIEGIKSLKGVNNSDIMEMLRDNKAALMEINSELKALKDEQKVKNSKPDSEKNTQIRVPLLN